jgi:hypothetical protein
MTQKNAERVANVVIGLAAAGAAYWILRTPHLRRTAFRLAGVALTGTLPAWLNGEVRRAWSESGRTARRSQAAV